MSCEDLQGDWVEYFDGNMDWKGRQNLERHIEICRNCRALMNTYRQTILLSGQILLKEPPADLVRQINQRLAYRLTFGTVKSDREKTFHRYGEG